MDRLVVVAQVEELKLVERIEELKGLPILVTGVGALNVMDVLDVIPRDVEIINVGYAGSKDLEVGKFYAVDKVSLYHPNVEYYSPVYVLDSVDIFGNGYCDCYSGCDFVLSSSESGCLFDMELGFIAGMGFSHIESYKCVSDNLSLEEYGRVAI